MPIEITQSPQTDAVKRNMMVVLRQTTAKAGDTMQASIRSKIPPPRGSWASCCHKAKGTMRNDARHGPVKRSKRGYQVRVGMLGSDSRKYQRIHETGGYIRARNKPYLVFKIGGRWIRVKEVYIRPKQYFRKGWKLGLRSIRATLPSYVKMTAKAKLLDVVVR